jgi:integrase
MDKEVKLPVKKNLTQTVVSKLTHKEKPYWITDAECKNLRLYVGKTGKVWYMQYDDEYGKHQSRKIGPADALTVAQAREIANEKKVVLARGESIKKEKPVERLTLGTLLNDIYYPNVQSQKSTEKNFKSLRLHFGKFFNMPVEELSLTDIEKWRTKQLNAGRKAATINRVIANLQAALNWAASPHRKHIAFNPLIGLERLPQIDSEEKTRYLTDEERERLEAALIAREERLRRKMGNKQRGMFFDYFRPFVILALNTGVRRGILLNLKWSDVDFNSEPPMLLLRPQISKSNKINHVPLNDDAVFILQAWKEQLHAKPGDLVFPSPKTGGVIKEIKRSWLRLMEDAKIENFRFHDTRHDFASQLLTKGENLNTVRDLLGHSDFRLTQRYGHLADAVKHASVNKLNKLTKGRKVIPFKQDIA